jgi:hypothetical protein
MGRWQSDSGPQAVEGDSKGVRVIFAQGLRPGLVSGAPGGA